MRLQVWTGGQGKPESESAPSSHQYRLFFRDLLRFEQWLKRLCCVVHFVFVHTFFDRGGVYDVQLAVLKLGDALRAKRLMGFAIEHFGSLWVFNAVLKALE